MTIVAALCAGALAPAVFTAALAPTMCSAALAPTMCSAALAPTMCSAALAPPRGSPSVDLVLPRGGQRGTETTITFHGERLGDAAGVLFYEPGIELLSIEAPDESRADARIRIAADCTLGEHTLRLRTRTGVSSLRTFWVGPFPIVDESEPNDDPAAAASRPPLARNVTVHGAIPSEDVDLFAIDLEAGERITAEVEGIRLADGLFDPFVAILDDKRFELASCDDSSLFRQDPVASCVVPAAGRYFVLVRESSYGGSDRCRYRLHLGTFPRPLVVSPAGARAGSELALRLIGDVRGEVVLPIRIPDDAPNEFVVWPEQDGVPAPSGLPMRIAALAPTSEVEPNDDLASATPSSAPDAAFVAFDGVIDRPGDVDWVRFAAKKDQRLHLRVHARSIRSTLDPVLSIHRLDGAQLDATDDSIGLDSYLQFTPPEDGEYVARVADHLGSGRATSVWRLVVAPVLRGLSLDVPRFGRDSQARQTVSVARGNRCATAIHVGRGGYAGDVEVDASGLPAGVTFVGARIAASAEATVVVFEAAADAPLGGELVDLGVAPASAEGDASASKLRGRLRQRFELVIGPPNDTSFYDLTVDRLAVAVTEEAPFAIDVVAPKAPLVQNGVTSLRVVAKRREGFDAPIVCRVLGVPPGVGTQPEIVIPSGQTEAGYPLQANGDAPLGAWRLVVQGEAESGRGLVLASSAPTDVVIAPPFVSVRLDLAAVEQGRTTQVIAHVDPVTPFEGRARILLHGLPPNASAPPRDFAAGEPTVVFDVTTAADTPAGKHTTLFVQVDVDLAGETVVHYLGGGGTLRVDPPPPPSTTAAAPPPEPAPAPDASATPAPPKPLSRLEQLRLEAKRRQQGRVEAVIAAALAFAGTVALLVTARGNGTAKELVKLEVHPPSLSLSDRGDVEGIVVQASWADGTTSDVTSAAELELQDPAYARIDGRALVPLADGATELRVRFEGAQVRVPVDVAHASDERAVSFRLDVVPVFTKAGCNAGTCHGSAQGQDGFRLSLFGFDPEGDHFRLTRQLANRRIDLAAPQESLVVQKALGLVTHTGGKRFEDGSEPHRVLTRWLDAGAPNDPSDVIRPIAVELYPPRALLEGAGTTQQLRVRAVYSDGSDRDVTARSAFFSSVDTCVAVSKDGLVTAGRRGEAFVTARFATFTVGVPILVIPAELDYRRPELPPGNYVDDLVRAKLDRLRIVPSGTCDDATFLRRVSLDVIGLAPTRAEFERFAADPDPAKRETLVDELLGRKEFAELWVMEWAELLQMRTDEQNRVPYKSTLLYFHWLEEQIARNVPFDQVVRELLSATGGTFRNPATNYWQIERDTLKTAENVAQVFLGMRIQCAQCHNHPFDRWTMDDYYGFAAFFAQIGRKNGEDPRETIVFDARAGEVAHPVGGGVMAPKLLGGATPDLAGRDRRAVVAEWITSPENPWFARNLVNRVWAHFFGRGIVEPVDDARVSNPPSDPELLDELARRFVEYRYDFKRLVRDLCNSRAYQLDTVPNASNELDERNFSHALVRRVRAEVLLDVVSQVTETPNKFPGLPLGARAVQIADGNVSNYFLDTFGRASRATVCSCEVKREPNLSQALHLLNGDATTQRIRDGGMVKRLLAAAPAPRDAAALASILDELYVRCLARRPTDSERVRLLAHLPSETDAAAAPEFELALEDLFWALLNSKEFAFNH